MNRDLVVRHERTERETPCAHLPDYDRMMPKRATRILDELGPAYLMGAITGLVLAMMLLK